MANGTVNPKIVRLVLPAQLDRTVPFSFERKFPEIYDREILETEILLNGTVISDQNSPSEKSGLLQKVDLLFQTLDRNVPFSSRQPRSHGLSSLPPLSFTRGREERPRERG